LEVEKLVLTVEKVSAEITMQICDVDKFVYVMGCLAHFLCVIGGHCCEIGDLAPFTIFAKYLLFHLI
jgi:hypothetical protein